MHGGALSCPGRGAAFFMPLRRAGTVSNAGVRYGPGSAAHRYARATRRAASGAREVCAMTDVPAPKIDLKAVLSGTSPTVAKDDHSEGMSYLQSVPRRMVTLYLPLSIIVIILLFPFYWMGLTAIKPDDQLLDLDKFNPFWTWNPTFKHIHKLLFESYYPHWLWNTMYVAVCATVLSIIASVLAAYAIVRLRYHGAQWVGGLIFLSYLVPPSILFIPLATVVFQYGLFDSAMALILPYPTILIPFSTWLLMGYFKTIPFELEECALIDGASRWQILTKI